jgi:hypothetical protein
MARKVRAEVEGGLYHVITRGNNRRRIFDSPADYEKFLCHWSPCKSFGCRSSSTLIAYITTCPEMVMSASEWSAPM